MRIISHDQLDFFLARDLGKLVRDLLKQDTGIKAQGLQAQLPCFNFREVEHIIDQRKERIATLHHGIKVRSLLLVELSLLAQLRCPNNTIHRSPNFMTHRR